MSATPITKLPAASTGTGDSRQEEPEGNALLTLDHVTKAFTGKDGSPLEILHPTTLNIGHGERIAIVGPSGSGKSTLLSLLGTLDMPTSGTLRYDGENVAAMGERRRSELRAERIGFVFQQFHLIATVSALENVMTGLQYTDLPRRERRERAAEALEQVGLGERLHHRPSQLSGGEQQRVAIARALAKQPDIIFADEPTGALDTDTGHAIIELLLRAADQGASLVVVTHDPNIAARFPRRLHIQDGMVTELDEGGVRHA
ncbi:ABC transporter ATP-binding protein [Bifidobacterium callitrichidarum]|uniref:ABC transporter ATP-binding protein n=1 Tax=Bifidobacterium callitrichidarum TaxID=2052941 RepID=UPI001F4E83BB|nr:ABC transporter ATP-binding protein [Bifidobacterium callitrichidarum]